MLLNTTKGTHLTRLNLSAKDLSLVPDSVLGMQETQRLDLSVNNLQRLPKGLWTLPLRELNLSHNPGLGRDILLILKGAARCTDLTILRLQDVARKG